MKYTSLYTDKQVTAAQLITEKICERYAERYDKTLVYQFWSLMEWRKFFKLQMIFANALLKNYSCQAILDGLADNRARSVYSLKNPILIDIVKEKQCNIDKQRKLEYNLTTNETNLTPQSVFKTKSIRDSMGE